MSIDVFFAVLVAAGFHAGWNTLIKIRGDRIIVMAVVTLFGSIFSLMVAPFVEFPDSASWPFLGLTILLHTLYHFFLPMAYNHGDLGQVYPISRGSAPLIVAIGALITVGERLSPLALIGVLCLASGVVALTFERQVNIRTRPKAVMFALVTGLMIASYTVVDGLGVRKAGTVLGFAVWLTIADGILTFIIVYAWKGRDTIAVMKRNLSMGMLGGTMQVSAYWIIVWALAHAPMASVSALRETSVLIAALISTFILKEGYGVWRFISAGLVTLGLAATKSGS